MKKSSIVLLACAGLVVIGGMMAFGGWMLGGATSIYWEDGHIQLAGGRFDPEGGRQTGSQALEPFDRIDIAVASENVTLVVSDHFGVEYDIAPGHKLRECGVENGEFRLTFAPQIQFGFQFGFGENSHVTLYYPKGTVFQEVRLGTASGGIRADGLAVSGGLELDATSGKIQLTDAKAGTFSTSTVSGDIQVEGLTTGITRVSTTSGNLRLARAKLGPAALQTVSGSLVLEDVDADGVTLDSTSGDFRGSGTIRGGLNGNTVSGEVNFEGTLLGDTKLNTTSGGVRLTTSASQDEYEYYLDSMSGSRRVNGMKSDESRGTNAKYRVEVNTVSGNIALEFGK